MRGAYREREQPIVHLQASSTPCEHPSMAEGGRRPGRRSTSSSTGAKRVDPRARTDDDRSGEGARPPRGESGGARAAPRHSAHHRVRRALSLHVQGRLRDRASGPPPLEGHGSSIMGIRCGSAGGRRCQEDGPALFRCERGSRSRLLRRGARGDQERYHQRERWTNGCRRRSARRSIAWSDPSEPKLEAALEALVATRPRPASYFSGFALGQGPWSGYPCLRVAAAEAPRAMPAGPLVEAAGLIRPRR